MYFPPETPPAVVPPAPAPFQLMVVPPCVV
jgi:hypothetical protein